MMYFFMSLKKKVGNNCQKLIQVIVHAKELMQEQLLLKMI